MRIAVIGSGISGLGAAYLLARAHQVTVFERDARAGGHTHTIEHDGLALDTGFLVHNVRNYPLLIRLFDELGVRTQSSEMSFSVSCDGCGLEYSGRRPFAQRRNAASARFGALVWEIARWLRTARRSLDEADYERHSLGAYLDERGYSQRFRRHFLVPLTSALWSTAPGRALEFPAGYAIRFFDNHGMLGFGRFRWRAVSGGSHSYVRAIGERLGPGLRLGLGVRSLRRDVAGAELVTDDGERHRFDEVVVATHSDQALALLEDPSEQERRVLGAFGYTKNDAVLHTDSRLLPRTRAARASWNYRLGNDGRPTVTYLLNRLQGIEGPIDYCVTLNQDVADEHMIRRVTYEHPLYTVESLAAQRELPGLSGRHTHYAGAHHGNGFHEDGLASGVRVAAALGVAW
ncbi:MAG: FAD-dependent oxidoreductase [Actinomycetota bacterium]|nr:FAD-dependent oxidoreductase [Actinomycetota bacterium]MDQ2981484.1 FAD-dependent oxidoreductase [Actinomycetota bacterium]